MEIYKNITGKTKVICLIGNPVEHSISPALHNTISKLLGMDLVYVTFRVEKNELETAIKGLRALNVIGFNVTVPYKKDVIKYLDNNSKSSLLMGAVNVVKNIDGRLYGYNTDADGFLRSFKEETGEGFSGKRVAMIGAGGAARAIAVKAAMDGAKEIHIINRTISKAEEIAEVVNNNIKKAVRFTGADDGTAADILNQSDIIINATSVGMYPNTEETPVTNFNGFRKGQIVYDVIYNPIKTKFLSDAEKSGCRIVNGLGMLFYQGIFAYEIWTGVKLPDALIKNLISELKNDFIGN